MFRHVPLIRVGRWSAFAALLALAAVPPARASVPVGPPVFTTPTTIDNSYFPFVPGAVQVSSGKKDGQANVIVDLFLTDTRTCNTGGGDVECRDLQETEFLGGKIEEISHNFFAQADDGSVWYFGETVDVYDDTGAIVSHEGSFLVGGPTLPGDPPETVTITAPGLFMPANPEVGDVYMPEDAAPAAQEQDTVESATDKQKTPAGKFTDVLRVHEFGALDGDIETKWYAPGVGVIRAKAKGEQVKLIATSLLPAGS